jgi:hypothetical protein
MKDKEDVIRLLRRIFKSGIIHRLPRKREDAEIFLALSLVGLDPDGFFDESKINIQLSSWLEGIASEDGIADYVTLRRQLVDNGFLRRASDGVVYRIKPERIDEVLSPSAKTVDVKAIFTEVKLARSSRRREFSQQ